jgi:hypothetical protein
MREAAVVERGNQGFTNVATSDARHIGVAPQCRHILMRYNDVPSHRRSRADLVLVECLSVEAHRGHLGKHRLLHEYCIKTQYIRTTFVAIDCLLESRYYSAT